jgi:DNA ligase-1
MNKITLEKKNARGGDQIWIVTCTKKQAKYEYGQKDGKMQTKIDTYTEGKQKRTAEQQAMFEAVSTAKKKMRLGYSLKSSEGFDSLFDVSAVASVKKVEGLESPKPMLAKEFEEKRIKGKSHVFVQPKLDGIRCLAHGPTGKLWTRGRKPLFGLEHIEKAVSSLCVNFPDIKWLDGEIFRQGMGFQKITSLAKKQKTMTTESQKLEYHVYDLVLPELSFSKRWDRLEAIEKVLINDQKGSAPIKIVYTSKIEVSKIQDHHLQFVKAGYEGTMIRSVDDNGYEVDKRSSHLLKKKDFLQEEFTVIGFNVEKTETGETLGSCIVEDPKNKQIIFSATPKMSDAEKLEIWKNQKDYLGKQATVKFFEYSRDKIPRFPVIIGIREHD